MDTIEANAPFTIVQIDVSLDADWRESLPQFVDAEGDPFDMSGGLLELYVRPAYDHPTLIFKFSTEPSQGILYDIAAQGLVRIEYGRSVLKTILPVGAWKHFLTFTKGGAVREIWRGPFIVHPGRT